MLNAPFGINGLMGTSLTSLARYNHIVYSAILGIVFESYLFFRISKKIKKEFKGFQISNEFILRLLQKSTSKVIVYYAKTPEVFDVSKYTEYICPMAL